MQYEGVMDKELDNEIVNIVSSSSSKKPHQQQHPGSSISSNNSSKSKHITFQPIKTSSPSLFGKQQKTPEYQRQHTGSSSSNDFPYTSNMASVRSSTGGSSTPVQNMSGNGKSSEASTTPTTPGVSNLTSSPKTMRKSFVAATAIRGGSSTSTEGGDLHQLDVPGSPIHHISTDPGNVSFSFQPQRSKSETKLFIPQGGSGGTGGSGSDKSQNSSKLSKRESLKVEKKKYQKEKKRAAKELLSTLKDPAVIVMADWLKIRGTLKNWTRMWCVLKPGLFVLYKSDKQKSSHWIGTIMLNTCELIERPSKKDGFCFKLFHPLDQSIWTGKGPKGENFGAITQPLPYSYLIFRAPSEAAGKFWMDALELALRCSTLLKKTMTKESRLALSYEQEEDPGDNSSLNQEDEANDSFQGLLRSRMNDSDCEKHFEGYGLEEDDAKTDKEEDEEGKKKMESDSDSDQSEEREVFDDDLQPIETPYVENLVEELGQQGDACQTEEVADENKSIIWSLVKQVRPGMDLSKVVLPTFILEPRSFLDKLTDYYYHADFLSEAVLKNDAVSRMKEVVRWYLAGFYKKPKGLKKPYNPIIGETFRCYWQHPKTGTKTFYMAEQISHHPPVSAFYVSNRQDGFSISGSILAKSKFYGNSLSALLDGVGRLTFLTRGEDYTVTMPYAHCKGILIGTLTMEYGGKVSIECEKTGYKCDLEFKLKPFLGSGEASNRITGKIRLGTETLFTLDGKWDQEVFIRDKQTGDSELFWNPTPEVKANRLKRFTVPIDSQKDHESEKLWQFVTEALALQDQEKATAEKFILEDAQRNEAKERKAKLEEWVPRYFERHSLTGDWEYKFKDLRPWDPMNDFVQFEHEYFISTKTRHRTPIVRTTSIANIEDDKRKTQSPIERARLNRIKRASMKRLGMIKSESDSSGAADPDKIYGEGSESTESDIERLPPIAEGCSGFNKSGSMSSLISAIQPLVDVQKQQQKTLETLNSRLTVIQRHMATFTDGGMSMGGLVSNRDLFVIAIVVVVQMILFVIFK